MTMQSSQDASSGRPQFVDGLNSAIRENPVAAGLVGLGVLWMFFGTAKVNTFANRISRAANDALSATSRGVADTVRSAGETAENYASEVVHKVSETAQHVSEAVEKRVQAVGRGTTRGGEDVESAPNRGSQAGKAVQQNLSNTIERQPLMLGAIGLGIGAAIASMFSATDLERNLMGETAAPVKERIKDILSETAERAEQVVEDVKNEAVAQGLTSYSAEASVKSVVEKIETVAAAGKESLLKPSPGKDGGQNA